MKKTILLILLFVFCGISIKYAQTVDALIEKGKEILYSGNVHFDQSEMFKARGMFERALASDEENYLAHFVHSFCLHSVWGDFFTSGKYICSENS